MQKIEKVKSYFWYIIAFFFLIAFCMTAISAAQDLYYFYITSKNVFFILFVFFTLMSVCCLSRLNKNISKIKETKEINEIADKINECIDILSRKDLSDKEKDTYNAKLEELGTKLATLSCNLLEWKTELKEIKK